MLVMMSVKAKMWILKYYEFKTDRMFNWYDCFYNTPGSHGGTELSIREQERIWTDK